MLRVFKSSLVLFTVLAMLVPIQGLQAKKEKPKEKEEEKGKPFEEVVKDFQKIEGLFTFYVKSDEGKVYMAIKPDQLAKVFMCNMTRSAGDGTYYDNGADYGEFLFELKRVGKNVQMVQKNIRFRADTTSSL